MVNHIDTYWDLTSGINDNKILSQLPLQLRAEIIRSMHSDTLHFSSLFRLLSAECAVQMLALLHTELILKNEILVAPSQNLVKVYMLMKGALTVTLDENCPLW